MLSPDTRKATVVWRTVLSTSAFLLSPGLPVLPGLRARLSALRLPSCHSIPGTRLLHEVAHAKARLGLGATAPVGSGDAAGREGFWWHRFLQAQGITHQVVDAASIEGNRRQRRAKRDA